jgi:archaellum component FlaF (FlaF/FlaG flagellin family)
MLKIIGITLMLSTVTIGSYAQERHGAESEEESGTQFTKSDTYKKERSGVKLILKYNKTTNTFEGEMTNVTSKVVKRARVEVHLSNGVELGPTKPKNLKPGETISVKLSAKGQNFKTWSAHAEAGSNEHGHKRGGEHSHRREGRGEHN